jgi:hypothetical protein
MHALHIRDVPDEVVAALQRSARMNRRSLQGELLFLLDEAARRAPPADPPPPLVLMVSEAPAAADRWSRDALYDDDAR